MCFPIALVLEAHLEASKQAAQARQALPNKPTYSVAVLFGNSIVAMTTCTALMAGCVLRSNIGMS
jgi:hypothetical protein